MDKDATNPLSTKDVMANSESVRSIRSELEVAECLKQLGWDVWHSEYYTDPIENKPRETDIVARRGWNWSLQGRSFSTKLALLVERKHLKANPLFFAKGEPRGRNFFDYQYSWPGRFDDGERAWLNEVLAKLKVEPGEADALIRAFDQQLMATLAALPPSQGALSDPPIAAHAVAFREGVESSREACNGVLWAACRALRATAIAEHRCVVAKCQEDVEYAMYAGDPERRLKHFIEEATDFLGVWGFRHSVVVVDAPLLLVDVASVVPVPSCRLCLRGLGDSGSNWVCDIVHSADAARYFASATDHFERELAPHTDFTRDSTGSTT